MELDNTGWKKLSDELPEIGHVVALNNINSIASPQLAYRCNDFDGYIWLSLWDDEEIKTVVNALDEWIYIRELI